MALTKLKEFMGWTISVAEDGTFLAEKPGQGYYNRRRADTLKRKNLKALETEIASRSSGKVEVMNFKRPWDRHQSTPNASYTNDIPSGYNSLKKLVIVQAAADGKFRDDKGNLHNYGTMAMYDQAIVDKVQEFLQRLEAAQQAIYKEYHEWARSVPLTELTPDQLRAMLAEQQQAAVAAGTEAQ